MKLALFASVSDWAFSIEEDFRACRVSTCSLCPWLCRGRRAEDSGEREDGICKSPQQLSYEHQGGAVDLGGSGKDSLSSRVLLMKTESSLFRL